MRRHAQDHDNVVHVAFRHRAPSTRGERLELERLTSRANWKAEGGGLTILAENHVVHVHDVCACHELVRAWALEYVSVFELDVVHAPAGRIIICVRCSHAISAGFSIKLTPKAEQPLCGVACSAIFSTALLKASRMAMGCARERDERRETNGSMSSP